MGLYFLIPFLLVASLFGQDPGQIKNKLLYFAHEGEMEKAISLYRTYHQITEEHDFDILHQMCLLLLEKGARSADPEEKLLTYFGAGISLNEQTVPILESGLWTNVPQLQMVCLNLLADLDTDRADLSIRALMKNPDPLIQLETTYCMAKKRSPMALINAEALLNKFPGQLRFIFPHIFSEIDSARSNSILKQLLSDPSEHVRLEAILTVMEKGRDDFLPQIRRLSKQTSPLQQEACAVALGNLKDETSVARLEQLAASPSPHVCIAAASSLFRLERKEYGELLAQGAKAGFPFAISAMATIPEAKELLFELTQTSNADTRLNAIVSLLILHDKRVTPDLIALLLEKRGKPIGRILSPAKAMVAFRYTNYHAASEEAATLIQEVSRSIRSKLLQEAINLPEAEFLQIAKSILEAHQSDLVPVLMRLLENLGNEQAIALLKTYQQKIGDPFVRNYCNLALYRMGEPGPWRENLELFIREQNQIAIIQFRPFLPLDTRHDIPSYALNPKETSQIYVEALEALTKSQGEEDVLTLLEAIEKGNAKNRYALAGLLMRAMQ